MLEDDMPTSLCQYIVDNQFFNIHVCFASFVAQESGDLSLSKGDIIIAINQINEHWMQGQVCYDGQSNKWPTLALGEQLGSFPLNHCQQIDPEQFECFCKRKIEVSENTHRSQAWPSILALPPDDHETNSQSTSFTKPPIQSIANTWSLSSRSSLSAISTNDHPFVANNGQYNHHDAIDNPYQKFNGNNFNNNYTSQSNHNISRINEFENKHSPTSSPKPHQLPFKQMTQSLSSSHKISVSEQAVVLKGPPSNANNPMSTKQQDKLKSWMHTVRKKTARLSTRITVSLGLLSLTRDESFERHYESFKQLERTIRTFIKNISLFIEHYGNFLMAIQSASENISELFDGKTQNQKELAQMKRKNKALYNEHFHEFKRTVEIHVIRVSSELLKKFKGPHVLISKRSSKLLDYDTKSKEMESCHDLTKKSTIRDEYVIAKDLYDRINNQLLHELPLFNQFALDIFRECIIVLLESRRNLIISYTKQLANLMETPLMASYTASDVASTIMMASNDETVVGKQSNTADRNSGISDFRNHSSSVVRGVPNNQDCYPLSGQTSAAGTQPSGSSGGDAPSSDKTSASRPPSAMSQLSSDFDHVNGMVAREISSTPLSQIGGSCGSLDDKEEKVPVAPVDEVDKAQVGHHANHRVRINISRISSNCSSDNRQNESIESRIESARLKPCELGSTPAPPQPPRSQAVADSDLEDNIMQHLRSHLNSSGTGEGKSKSRTNRESQRIYIASWPFLATGPNQLSIACNQKLKLIKDSDECGNADWSLVKDRRGQVGYVPTSYIKKRD